MLPPLLFVRMKKTTLTWHENNTQFGSPRRNCETPQARFRQTVELSSLQLVAYTETNYRLQQRIKSSNGRLVWKPRSPSTLENV